MPTLSQKKIRIATRFLASSLTILDNKACGRPASYLRKRKKATFLFSAINAVRREARLSVGGARGSVFPPEGMPEGAACRVSFSMQT